MSHRHRRIADALNAAGAQLIRETNHRVYRLANGATLVLAQTPSDRRVEQNILADIRRLMTQPEVRR